MKSHKTFMNRCIQLAKNGLGTTYPNPLVGSLILSEEGQILGEGWHYKSGRPHAEVMAVRDAEKKGYDESAFAKATLYVNLEPCSHTGKTPPCATMIIAKGFKKVVIGTLDPHEKVAGKGVQLLKDAGIEVITNICAESCHRLNRRFFTYHTKKRPYIILKWAETADGFIAPLIKEDVAPVWITSKISRQHAHRTRAREQAILIGAKTLLDDNPSLTCRQWHGHHPTRIVWDHRGKLPKAMKIFDDQAETLILQKSENELDGVLDQIYAEGIQSVIIEGGAKTLQKFIDSGHWDEAHQYMGAEVLFHQGTPAPLLHGQLVLHERRLLGKDILKTYYRS
ncbi:bifunctional diaminohydroxyphosphoribosylaminopyrimidine deaminase/5-amino-6-(5-phosphoribosylamino)uracil reductase RibD [Nonlabens xiamenensis]|uniref:bifunctional diaminohydroxyphosphoribosylaminopyrimidine deaminase/5-amino-6-(5-phosphoribosylamino)uracil reductase RibD n=1 Tax=Nonlabens xiamenensis TaxID=2341043 RepID=UPI000F605D58|nr:bifunctional diaminohydroxyphosphoribosylaminopyrimidine deaminase/5-amino-6-(5-phosphoribosylamino)uracil reductase RibD [Nonlabens xiamenensis]